MDSMLVIIGFCCVLIGVIGAFSCGAWSTYELVGLALLYFTTVIPANYWILSITLLVTIITSILEYIIRPEEQNDSEEVPMAFGEQISD
jgi:uncharacterized membrane protein